MHWEKERATDNGYFGCYHPILVFDQFGDCEGAKLRPGNVHSAYGWREVLEPIAERYAEAGVRRYFRADAAFARPGEYEYLEEHDFLFAIRLPCNDVLAREVQHLIKRRVGSWDRPRRVLGKSLP